VTAAAGGVGGLLAQLLVATGARVVGLAGDARKREHARSLGADVVVDYRAPGWVEQVRRAAPEGVDVVFDGVSGDLPDLLLPAVRSGGRYVQHGAAAGRWTRIEADRAAAAGVTVVPLAAIGTPEELHRATDEALRLAAEGRLRVTVGQVFPLAEATAAHAALGSREALGKTLLRP
ncbi:MAG TPA: zinc-binding dehydrogenase, partial [Actinotalea caeni]|uniref:zinc-binding dehydrogenase n=1 Tax=Actinotalea caeni TaxID=1348467 RepID=UPI002B4B3632